MDDRKRNKEKSKNKSSKKARHKHDTSKTNKSLEQVISESLKIIQKLSLTEYPILYSELELDLFNSKIIDNNNYLNYLNIKSLQLKTYLFHTLFYSISILFRGARALSRKSIVEDIFSEVINKISEYLKKLNNEYYNLCLNDNYKQFITSKSIQKMYNIAIDTNDDNLKTNIINKIKEKKISANEISNAKILRILSKSTGTIIYGLTALAALVTVFVFSSDYKKTMSHRADVIKKYLELIDLQNINYEINLMEKIVIYELINKILKINDFGILGFHNIRNIHPVILEWQNALQTDEKNIPQESKNKLSEIINPKYKVEYKVIG